MSEQNEGTGLTLELTPAELRTVLGVMRARSIPGLVPTQPGAATGEATAEEEIEATRALQARGLAQTDEEGRVRMHRALLKLVGTCAYSQSAMIAFHWPAGQETPVPFYGHVRGSDVVAHTVPAAGVHRFSRLLSKEALVDRALEMCEFGETQAARPQQVVVPRDAFEHARELAGQGQAAGAVEALSAAGLPSDVVQGLAATLTATPRVSALQTLKQQENSVRTRESVLIQDARSTWLVMPASVDPGGRLLAKTVGRAELRGLLADWL